MSNSYTSVVVDFEDSLDGESLSDIQELADLIGSNHGLDVRASGDGGPDGAKPALTSTLAVVGAVTGVAGLVLQAIGIWKGGKRKYSISITEEGRTFTVDNLSREEYLSMLQRLNRSTANAHISVAKRGDA